MVQQDMLFIVLQEGSRYTKIAEITKGLYCKIIQIKLLKERQKILLTKLRSRKKQMKLGVDVFSAYSAAKAVKVK